MTTALSWPTSSSKLVLVSSTTLLCAPGPAAQWQRQSEREPALLRAQDIPRGRRRRLRRRLRRGRGRRGRAPLAGEARRTAARPRSPAATSPTARGRALPLRARSPSFSSSSSPQDAAPHDKGERLLVGALCLATSTRCWSGLRTRRPAARSMLFAALCAALMSSEQPLYSLPLRSSSRRSWRTPTNWNRGRNMKCGSSRSPGGIGGMRRSPSRSPS